MILGLLVLSLARHSTDDEYVSAEAEAEAEAARDQAEGENTCSFRAWF